MPHPAPRTPWWPGSFSATEIGLQHILLHHPLGVEEGTVDGHGKNHHLDETLPLVVEEGNNGLFQLLVKGRSVQGVVSIFSLSQDLVADGPAGQPLDMPLDPPPVQHTQIGNAVEGRLHPAGSRSLQGGFGGVEPEVDAGGDHGSQRHVVIFEVGNADILLEEPPGLEDPFDHPVGRLVPSIRIKQQPPDFPIL